jgi:hypothetical protein
MKSTLPDILLAIMVYAGAAASPDAVSAVAQVPASGGQPLHRTENVIFLMTDGFRWQDMFAGAEEALVNKQDGGIADMASFKKRFWRDSPEARREALLPFVWGVVARQGQIYGNRWKGSEARVTNGLKFSYPGYQETLCGFPDPRIRSNEMGPNPNVTVLEWLNRKDAYRGRVAAFGAWDAFDRILNRWRCGFCVNAGFAPLTEGRMNAQIELLNRLKQELPRQWNDLPPDAITFHTALEYLKQNKPRVLYVSLGETDEWGHAGRYDEYLAAAQRADQYLRTLWETAQAMPEYRGRTTLIFSPDHGRGGATSGKQSWRNHAADIDGAEMIWLAVLGPDTPALGERHDVPPVTQSQIAATLAAFLGEDYAAAVPRAAKPIADALRAPKKARAEQGAAL